MGTPMEKATQRAIKKLGERWVYHPNNRVKKLSRPLRLFAEPVVLNAYRDIMEKNRPF
jgi:hypothetical protein